MEKKCLNTERGETTDLLNRQGFIDRYIEIADILAQSNSSVCYAIDGRWGVGKSFVLDKIAKHEGLADFWKFRYNCWECDYYEEPLVAIVASMLREIDENTHILSPKVRKRFVEIIKVVGKGVIKKGTEWLEEKSGINVKEVIDTAKGINEDARKQDEKEYAFDDLFPLRNALSAFRDEVKELAKEYPIIFFVDELDRCLPEYAIKVLERLHHVFEGIPRVQVVLSIDKTQLEHTVRQIFGESMDVKRYLAKFLAFDIHLSEGTFTEAELFDLRFEKYLCHFGYFCKDTLYVDVDEFKNRIFDGIDIRTRIAIIDKCQMVHELLQKEKTDYVYMCIELFLAIIKYIKVDMDNAEKFFSLSTLFALEEKKTPSAGLQFLSDKLKRENIQWRYYSTEGRNTYIYVGDIFGALLAAYRCVLNKEDYWLHGHYRTDELKDYIKNYWALLEIIN